MSKTWVRIRFDGVLDSRKYSMLISFCSLVVFGLVIRILAFNLLGLKWFCFAGFSDAKVPNMNTSYEL